MTLLIIAHILICIFLVIVILVQPGKSDAGIGFGSSSQSIFGSKGAGNFLTKTTSVCAIIFLLTSFVLTRSRILDVTSSVIKDDPKAATPKEQKTPDAAKTGTPTPQPSATPTTPAPTPAPAKSDAKKK